jgi:hypothetical protein
MHILAQAFWLPKAGNSKEEYEDAFWPERQIDQSAEAFSFAVADGATETSFSGLWAKMLVRAYCRGKLAERKLFKSLPALQKRWLECVSKPPLPWFAEEKLRSGAFSSIVGLTIRHDTSRNGELARWKALAIGDSCLFQVRGNKLITSFPYTDSGQFNSRPSLLSSNPIYNDGILNSGMQKSGSLDEGDTFYLMTDALACWFLRAVELNQKPWEILRDFATSDEMASFSDWIANLRKAHLIRNDDVTLLRVEAPL